ncbi:MAG: hypothetical protein U1F57_01490 [bacterium]
MAASIENSTPSPETVLSRFSQTSLSSASSEPTTFQRSIDGMISAFVEQTGDWRTFTAMAAGSLFYRFGRLGTLVLASRAQQAAPLLRVASYGIGLASEVTAFQGTSDILSSLETGFPHPGAATAPLHASYWDRWRTSFVQFGLLKIGGAATQGQNALFQHLLQDTAMVAGHQATARLGWTSAPDGNLAEQFLHAEVTNLQMGLGMGLLHRAAPGLSILERSLDFSIRRSRYDSFFPARPFFSPISEVKMLMQNGVPAPRPGPVVRGKRGNRNEKFSLEIAPPAEEAEVTPKLPPPLRVQRVLTSRSEEGNEQSYPYELILEDWSSLQKYRQERVMALREGREVFLQITHVEKSRKRDDYFPEGTPVFHFRLREGNRIGEAKVYVQPEAINLYKIVTDKMLPGVGSLFLEWLATQAALQQKAFNVIRVENPRIFHILSRSDLIVPGETTVEACSWNKRGRSYRIDAVSPWGDPAFFLRLRRGINFLNIRSQPNPSLLPPAPEEASPPVDPS